MTGAGTLDKHAAAVLAWSEAAGFGILLMRFLVDAGSMRRFLQVLAIVALPASGLAQEAAAPLPRFASLDSRLVNLRAGPGKDYPILWVYQRKGLPVEIIQEFENWRRIRDQDGTLGWVQRNLLSGRRMVKIVVETTSVFERPETGAPRVADLQGGVIARLRECPTGPWCRIEIEGLKGWIARDAIWGVREGEVVVAD